MKTSQSVYKQEFASTKHKFGKLIKRVILRIKQCMKHSSIDGMIDVLG
jgi:hypothetical protein